MKILVDWSQAVRYLVNAGINGFQTKLRQACLSGGSRRECVGRHGYGEQLHRSLLQRPSKRRARNEIRRSGKRLAFLAITPRAGKDLLRTIFVGVVIVAFGSFAGDPAEIKHFAII
ncbi:MAG: hypothetical protein ACLP5H_17010 [Desulfomonilaceae bacterium]